MKIGISLSGGGAKCAAHIGVLAALAELGICPTHISGTSAGAVIGSLFCKGYSPSEILELSQHHSFLKIFHLGLVDKGLTDLRFLDDFLSEVVGSIRIESLSIPLYICATNINSGSSEIFDKGPLKESLMASCAIPILFKPVKLNDNLYVDGGVLNNLPIEPLKKVCDKVIGINVCTHNYQSGIRGIRDIGIRCYQLAIWNTMDARLKQCDVAIDLTELRNYGLFEFDKANELFEIGLKTVLDQKDRILAQLQEG